MPKDIHYARHPSNKYSRSKSNGGQCRRVKECRVIKGRRRHMLCMVQNHLECSRGGWSPPGGEWPITFQGDLGLEVDHVSPVYCLLRGNREVREVLACQGLMRPHYLTLWLYLQHCNEPPWVSDKRRDGIPNTSEDGGLITKMGEENSPRWGVCC